MTIPLNKYGLPEVLDDRDTSHNAGFCALAHLWNNEPDIAEEYAEPIKGILWKILWPYKNPTYFYSNSDGFTMWLYNHIFKYFKFDPLKGTNADQTEPMNQYFLASKQFIPQFKFILGLILRLGFYPNFEHILSKPSHLGPFFRTLHFKPLYWVTDFFSYISTLIELKRPISESTTNKIRLYIELANAEKQPTMWAKKTKELIKGTHDFLNVGSFEAYWKQVFTKYWNPTSPLGKTIHRIPFDKTT